MAMIRFFVDTSGLKAFMIDKEDIYRIRVAVSQKEAQLAKGFSPLLERMEAARRDNQEAIRGHSFFGDLREEVDGIIYLTEVYIRNGAARPVPMPLPGNLEELGFRQSV
jgi:hypothetical protein